jgi:hypothetical protein
MTVSLLYKVDNTGFDAHICLFISFNYNYEMVDTKEKEK